MTTADLGKTLTSFLPPNLSIDALYAALRHGSHQRPIAWSCKNVAIVPSWVPDKKVPGLMNPSLRLLSRLMGTGGEAKLWDACMEDISMFHGQSNISQVLWNHSGNFFVTIDEKGKLVIWANKRYLNAWLPVYMVVLYNPVVCCEWINPERMYVASKSDGTTRYERERTGRHRSPPSLVILSADGHLTVFYKHAGQVFTHESTRLFQHSTTEDLTSSRISHGSFMSSNDGIYLVTHVSNSLPSTISLYHIDLRFTPEVSVQCNALAVLHISSPLTGPGSVMTPGVVQHIQLLPPSFGRPCSVAVALGSREENESGNITYKSQIVLWDITPKLLGFHPAFQELSTRRNDAVTGQPSLTFVMVGERAFFGKFISAMSYIPRSRELILGFSDGGLIGLESCFFGHLDLAPTLLDSTPTLLDGFRKESDGVPVIALHPSPNGLTLLYRTLNGQISSVSTADAPASGYEPDLDSFVQYAVVAILNEWDYSDIISTVIAASKTSSDPKFVDRFMESIFKSYDLIKGAEDTAQVEPFLPKASVLRRMLAFQLVLFQAFPEKSVQFKVTSALLHLQSIGEALSGCCTSEPSVLASHLELTPGVTPGQQPPQQLTFDTDALWSIYPLCGWTLDFCTILFRELAIFLNMKTATSSSSNLGSGGQSPQLHHSPTQSSSSSGGVAPSLLCFLYHSRARKTLRSVLILLEQYQLFVRNRELLYMRVIQTGGPIEAPPSAQNAKGGSNNSSGAPNSRINSMSISEAVALKDIHSANLFQHVEATFTKCPLKVGVLKSMLRDLNGIGTQVDFGRVNGNGSSGGNNPSSEVLDKVPSDHAIFINGTIPSTNSNAVAQAKTELRMITRRYPNPWDMNKLIFSTIHWFDLEPANMTPSLQAEPRQKVLAMHPSRCRIDPATALKARPSSMISANIGKQSFTLLQHQLPNMSNQGAPAGPRPQLTTAQARRQSHGFPEASSAVANGSTAGASGTSHIDTTALHSGSEIYDLPSIWGRVDNDGSDDGSMARNEGTDEAEASQLKSICFQWNSMLSDQEANQRLDGHDTIPEDEADMVPDDDVAMDNDFENEDDVESDEDLREKTRRDSRRMSMMATLKPSSQWLLHEFQTVSKRTRSDWTVFPVLGYDRPFAGFDSTTVESGQLTLLGLQGHAVPLDLRSSEDLLSSQSTIEAQVRKRRFGVDPIRKTKKYKTTGHGRQCIRCLQISTSNSANVKATLANSGFRRPIPHQIGLGPTAVNDIASTTLWYHNYDRSCICGGMWLEL